MVITPRKDPKGPGFGPGSGALGSWSSRLLTLHHNQSTARRLKGRYSLDGVLGHGTLGTTCRAFDHKLRRPVAIKLFSGRHIHDGVFAASFMAAASVSARLRHPHIAAVLDAGLVDGRPFIVMERAEGGNLQHLLASRGQLPIDQCRRIALQIADALCYAHRQGLVHGNLKLENVLLDGQGRAKVTDFGLARAMARADGPVPASIPQGYAALSLSEQTSPEPDERTDICAVGALIYELLVGRPPSTSSNGPSSPLKAGRKPSPPRLFRRDLSPQFERSVMRALLAGSGDGFSSARELQLALAAPELTPTLAAPPAQATRRLDVRHPAHRGSRGFGHSFAALVPLAATLAIVAAAVVALTGLFPRLFSSFQMTEAPRLVDYGLTEAGSVADAYGLSIRVTGSQPTDDRPKGTVLAQHPTPGTRLRRGSEIKLTVSAGMRPPNVVGKSVDEGRAALIRAGWSVIGVEPRADSNAPAGIVVGSRPGPEELAEDDKRGLTLLVSSGNLAYRGPLRLSNGGPGGAEMVDGDPTTLGSVGGPAPCWVEVDLAQPSTVSGVDLVTAQERPGVTIHEVWVWTTSGEFRGMHTFVGPTEDNSSLAIHFVPVANVRAVRIATTQGVGDVAWREIRVW